MTDRGLIIRHGGVVVFNSRRAAGGVCLGMFRVPGAQTVLSFPHMPRGRTPIVVYSDGSMHSNWLYDEVMGYPRFVFPAVAMSASANYTVGVYLK
ncbi:MULTISPECIES: hypothetical protein [unclassified Janthinobacterium]|uniref:hypothetical protein n=1 Tax=unclassified Janthinobacterium TaxID=2610881 RepID=UPI0016167426|nr:MULTISPECIES: hypothetical protein [unclassified Janthinobacterium]MBB5368724.1 hypothetical protein [Janthinobacterium sp. K2C7]MBB5381740.1 hypothetical protein [Janthinobacterium sp. K2Li3]MBB5387106.1 hypothetical protein [Janthinobacterium sp. K2E3]